MAEPKPTFLNPYLGCVEHHLRTGLNTDKPGRANADIAHEDFHFIQKLRIPDKIGLTQTIINILWSKLVYECKRRGITSIAQQAEFEQLVSECCLRLPGEHATNESLIEWRKGLPNFNGATNGPTSNSGTDDLPRGTPTRVAPTGSGVVKRGIAKSVRSTAKSIKNGKAAVSGTREGSKVGE